MIIGTIMLIFALIRKSEQLKEFSLALLVIMALVTIPVFLTGEPAEETVENIAGIPEVVIEEHEESAEIAIWIMMAAGALSLISLVTMKMHIPASSMVVKISLAVCLLATGAMARTGYLGGQIRHSEIREGGMANAQVQPAGGQGEEDDD
jgi:hypothetical protein